MKFRILRSIPQSTLVNVVPTEYQPFLPHVENELGFCTAIMFRHDKRDVIHSREVTKALRYLGETTEKVLAIGGGFTAEAEDLLRQRKVETISYSSSWTDQSHENIKVFIGSKVKKPVVPPLKTP